MTKEDKIVVILHGWRTRPFKYAPLRHLLERNNYIVYIPGISSEVVGINSKKALTLSDYLIFVKKFLSQKNIKRCIIIGHSFGGRIAIKLAADSPKIVKKLILTGVPAFRPVRRIKILSCLILAKIGRLVFSLPILNILASKAREIFYKAIRAQDYYREYGIRRQTFKNIISENLTKPMRKIRCETVLIWGENDRIVPIFVAKKIRKEIKNSKLILISKSGHNVLYEKPELYLRFCELS